MKKMSVILVSLILLISTIGIGFALGCCIDTITASPNKVKVGELITVECRASCPGDQLTVEGTGNASFIDVTVSEGFYYTYTYRANKVGTVKFYNSFCTVRSNEVLIVSNSYPMFSFMKILGFGKSD